MREPEIEELKHVFRILLDTYGPQHWWPASTRFEIAIGAILVQNTMWRNVRVSIKNLEKLGLLEPYRMYVASSEKIANAIKTSGFPRLKTDRLRNFLRFFERFSFNFDELGKLETDLLLRSLLSVNGIGRETADSLLLYIFKRPTLIVDAYTKRLFFRLGYSSSTFKEKAKSKLVEMFENDPDKLGEFHALIVQHSKAYCRTKPLCDKCPLSSMCELGGSYDG